MLKGLKINPLKWIGALFMPAYARMDTLEQKSLESREIARLFRRARAHLGHTGINNGVYLAALAATLQNMEEQIYEHFRSVEDLLVEGARRIGKSTAVEEFAKREYESYILIDFANVLPEVNDLVENSI